MASYLEETSSKYSSSLFWWVVSSSSYTRGECSTFSSSFEAALGGNSWHWSIRFNSRHLKDQIILIYSAFVFVAESRGGESKKFVK